MKEKFGLEPACDCTGRQAWLNEWGDQVRNWWRCASHIAVSIPIHGFHWALIHSFTDLASRITTETIWPKS